MSEQRLPPVTALAMLSLALVLCGGIYLAANVPDDVSLVPAVVLLAASAAVLVTNLVLLARVRDFAWWRFFGVFRWALLAYVVTAGMIEYGFLRNDMPDGPLAVLSASLVVYALHVPTLIAFTVARHERDPGPGR